MFRLTDYMQQLITPTPPPRPRAAATVRPVVIWNLTRRCNLRCRHCYTVSADVDLPGELSHDQALATLDDLGDFGVPALILSGGEPLDRFDFFDLARAARPKVRMLALSTNGTKIHGQTADRVAEIGFDYVGISIDGIGATNDWFRGVDGAFNDAVRGVRECRARGIKVGLRFTLTRDNAGQLPDLLRLCDDEGVDKFYLSHLVYAGRGDKNRGEDAVHDHTRAALDTLIARGWQAATGQAPLDIVTGNNDADASTCCVGPNGTSTRPAWRICARTCKHGAAIPPAWGWPISTRWGGSTPIPTGRTTPSATSRRRGFPICGRATTRCWPSCAAVRAR